MEEKICHREKFWIVKVTPVGMHVFHISSICTNNISLSGWPFTYKICPHSIFINNHANVWNFLTVSLTQCHISNSVWQYIDVTNGFHINCQKIKKGNIFLKKQ